MFGQYIVVSFTIFATFILFLVISRTFNNIINLLVKLEYLLQKEHDLKIEALEVRKLMDEQPVNLDNHKPEKRT
jgi:hypothetical protein